MNKNTNCEKCKDCASCHCNPSTEEEVKAIIEEVMEEAEQEGLLDDEPTAPPNTNYYRPGFFEPPIRKENGDKLGRNEKCYCGSGWKYKNCCWSKTH